MKLIFTTLIILLSSNLIISQSCIDTTVFANFKQTKYDNRFSNYKKIKSQPKYKGGTKKFENFLRENLIVDPRLKNEIFNLNYQITISCDGKIIEAKTLGDKRIGEMTNFIEIAQKTEGNWKPAKNKGNEVNCIYFSRMFINSNLYQK